MTSDLPQPTATGTLAKTPLPHLLIYLMEKQLTGSVELAAPDGERATLLVLEGYPSKARTSEPTSYLGHVLLEAGLLTEEQLHQSLEVYRPGEGKLHGQVLVEMGFLDMTRLMDGLRRQVIHKLEHLYTWPPETEFSYFDSFDALADYGADDMVTVDPFPLVWGAIKQAPSWEHVHATLSRVGSAPLRMSPNAQVERFDMTNDERQFIELIRPKPRRLYELTSAGTIGPSVKQLLVYCLLITKQIEMVADDAAGARRSGAPPPLAPSQPVPAPSALGRVQLQARPVQKPPASGVVEERAPGVRRRDARASSPTLTPLPKGAIEAAIAEATKNLDGASSGSMPLATPAGPLPVPTPPPPSAAPPPIAASSPSGPPSTRAPVSQRVPPPVPGPRADLPQDLAEQRAKIMKRAEEITKQDYFQMLGVSRDATTEEVQKAYFLLAKVWHPDRLPPAINDVKEHCTKVFAHISEAHQTLTDDERRRHYMTLVKDGGATPDDQQIIMNVLEAATNFQKAEVCLRRNDLTQAEQLVRAAHTADPKQADYLALLAWLEAMKPDAQSNAATQAKIAMLDEAVKLNARCERAYFYRGMLHKRLGNDKAAYKDFKESADLNPRNVDAVREVRLYGMRKNKGSVPPGPASSPPGRPGKKPEPTSGGIFGKLFKK